MYSVNFLKEAYGMSKRIANGNYWMLSKRDKGNRFLGEDDKDNIRDCNNFCECKRFLNNSRLAKYSRGFLMVYPNRLFTNKNKKSWEYFSSLRGKDIWLTKNSRGEFGLSRYKTKNAFYSIFVLCKVALLNEEYQGDIPRLRIDKENK